MPDNRAVGRSWGAAREKAARRQLWCIMCGIVAKKRQVNSRNRINQHQANKVRLKKTQAQAATKLLNNRRRPGTAH